MRMSAGGAAITLAGCATGKSPLDSAGTIRTESPERQARKFAALESLKELGPSITDIEVRRTKNIKGKRAAFYLDDVMFLFCDLARQRPKSCCNQIVVDVGEFLKYPSHPELAVRGSWSAERLAAEVKRLNEMGFEVVPKLNFSCCHRTWLGEYGRMISTPKYYEVCSDLIRDVLEVFSGTRFLHIGMDEEHMPTYQRNSTLLVMRQGELWWHDVLWLVKEVEKHGVRAWMWHDFLRKNTMADFAKRMPKTVVQSPWAYQVDDTKRYENLFWIFKTLSEGGYDTVPCSSHCYGGDKGFVRLAEWCRDNMDPAHFIGYQMAPWMQTGEAYRRLLFRGSELLAEARRVMG